jgi:hypothetical protein
VSVTTGSVLTTALLVAMAGLIGYQVYMLRWTKRTAGSVPGAIKVLRGANIVLLLAGTGLIIWSLARG